MVDIIITIAVLVGGVITGGIAMIITTSFHLCGLPDWCGRVALAILALSALLGLLWCYSNMPGGDVVVLIPATTWPGN